MYLCIVFNTASQEYGIGSQPTHELAIAWAQGVEDVLCLDGVDATGIGHVVVGPGESLEHLAPWVQERVAEYRAQYAPLSALAT